MPLWISRFLSIDDLWSVAGYVALLGISRLSSHPPDLSVASLMASGMLAIVWLASPNIRARNLERGPNVRVVVWALIAAVSVYMATR
jgi:hypothetical protein